MQGRKRVSSREQVAQRIFKNLNLTDAQNEQLRSLMAKYREQMKLLRNELQKQRRVLMDIISSAEIDVEKADKIIDAIVDAQRKLLEQKVKHSRDLLNILGKEDFLKLQKLHKIQKQARANRVNRNKYKKGGVK